MSGTQSPDSSLIIIIISMKVRIMNNRLALEAKTANLSDVSQTELKRIGAKYQIGDRVFAVRERDVLKGGRTVTTSEEVITSKPRSRIEDEIRKYLSVTFYIPRHLWTEEQEDAFYSNDLLNEKDISVEQRVKQDAGIMVVLPPFEDVVSTKQIRMFADVTEEQWEHLKETFNSKYIPVKDSDGKVIGKKRTYVHRLKEVERIPETKEEEAMLKEEEKKEAEESGKIKTKSDGKKSKA